MHETFSVIGSLSDAKMDKCGDQHNDCHALGFQHLLALQQTGKSGSYQCRQLQLYTDPTGKQVPVPRSGYVIQYTHAYIDSDNFKLVVRKCPADVEVKGVKSAKAPSNAYRATITYKREGGQWKVDLGNTKVEQEQP